MDPKLGAPRNLGKLVSRSQVNADKTCFKPGIQKKPLPAKFSLVAKCDCFKGWELDHSLPSLVGLVKIAGNNLLAHLYLSILKQCDTMSYG